MAFGLNSGLDAVAASVRSVLQLKPDHENAGKYMYMCVLLKISAWLYSNHIHVHVARKGSESE